MAVDTSKKSKSSDEEILRVARERFKLAEEAWRDVYAKAAEDLEFLSGNQWASDDQMARRLDSRPCLTVNRLPQFMRQITNDQRQNRPAIKVRPVDDKADIETAKIFQGIIRHIESASHADTAYDTAFEGAVGPSFGFFRILTDYISPKSFDQEIKIGRIPNQFSVYLDPFHKEPDGSDSNWGFIFNDIPEEDYKSEFPDSKMSEMSEWESIMNYAPGWTTGKTCRVAEYFYKEYKDVTIYQLPDGSAVEKEEIPPEYLEFIGELKTRKASIPMIKWCKLNGVEILEKTDWLGEWIPIIPVYGNELIVNGKRVLEGIIRHAKDPQKMLNLWVSTETEMIALAPKAPFIVAEGQIPKQYEEQWKTANRKTHAFLTYKPTSHSGQSLAPPMRNVYEPPVQAISNARMQSSDDLKATTGIYDSALGAQSREISGIAIRGRQAQSQTSNFHFIDNLSRSLRHAGRIIVGLIPKVYDAARVQRIIGEEGEQEIVMLNQMFEHKGEQRTIDLSVGRYDVTVETGPSFATKRQEAAASMLDFMRSMPQQAGAIVDLMVKNMDWPGSTEVAERLRKTLPPGMVDDKDNKQQQVPPQIQQQLQQQGQLIEQLTQHLNEASEEIKTKKIEIESKERIAFKGFEIDLEKEKIKLMGMSALKTLEAEIQDTHRRLDMLRINEPIETESAQPQLQNQNQEFQNEMSPDQASLEQQQQPTGGLSPG